MCGSTDFLSPLQIYSEFESSLSSVLTLILTEIKLVFVRSEIYANICIATLGTEALSAITANLRQPGQLVFNCDGYKVWHFNGLTNCSFGLFLLHKCFVRFNQYRFMDFRLQIDGRRSSHLVCDRDFHAPKHTKALRHYLFFYSTQITSEGLCQRNYLQSLVSDCIRKIFFTVHNSNEINFFAQRTSKALNFAIFIFDFSFQCSYACLLVYWIFVYYSKQLQKRFHKHRTRIWVCFRLRDQSATETFSRCSCFRRFLLHSFQRVRTKRSANKSGMNESCCVSETLSQ